MSKKNLVHVSEVGCKHSHREFAGAYCFHVPHFPQQGIFKNKNEMFS